MSTYVQLDRDDIENWLSANRWDWTLKDGTAGIYLLKLSPSVAIHFSSTVGRASSARGHAKASANMKLVSLITGKTLNKKAKGQSRFHRTTNWAKNWNDGLLRLKAAYEKSKGFYDAIAEIEDRDEYKDDLIARIEAFTNWSQNDFLSSLHNRLSGGGVLTIKQKDALERMESRRRPEPEPEPAPTPSTSQEPSQDEVGRFLNDLRALWVVAPDDRDWITSMAARVKRNGTFDRRSDGRRVDGLLRQYKDEVAQARRNDRRLRQASAAFLAATLRVAARVISIQDAERMGVNIHYTPGPKWHVVQLGGRKAHVPGGRQGRIFKLGDKRFQAGGGELYLTLVPYKPFGKDGPVDTGKWQALGLDTKPTSWADDSVLVKIL